MSVLRSQAGWKTMHFKGMTLEEIQEKFDPVWKQMQDFIPIGSKEEGERFKRKVLNLEKEGTTKVKITEEVPEEKLKEMMQLIPVKEVYVEALQVKHPIIGRKCLSPKSTGFNEFSSNIAIALVCLATNRVYKFSKMIFDDEHVSPFGDDSQGEACPIDSGFGADQDRANIAKTSTLASDSTPRVTSLAADEGSMQQKLNELMALCTSLQRQQSKMDSKFAAQELEITNLKAKVRSLDKGKEAAERVRVQVVPTAAEVATATISIPTGSGVVSTASPTIPIAALIFTTAIESTPYTRRKGKETMVESEIPKKKKIARDAEIARIHAEEELQMLIDGLDKNNETVAKYLQEYYQFAAELPIERRIELISDLVKYQDNYAKVLNGFKEEGERFKIKALNLEKEGAKKVKITEEVPEVKLKEMMQLILVEEVYVEALQVKHPIIDWKHFDREDLTQLWGLVKETLSIRPATKIENLKELRVNIIRCDNRGEFRNKEMNDFCSRKGIKREFSNARTPQQNGVAERRNRTLIEAARTMLADAKLPVTFWAEAVNTACYVQNRVLVNKSQNKTSYELFNSRSPAIGFLKPFGCHVMILNTLDNLGTKEDAGQDVKKDVSSLRYIVLPNWFHEVHLESSTSNAQDTCSADAPESIGNSNPTATSTNPPADHMETLAVETSIPTVSSPVLTACLNNSLEPSSDTRLISKRVTSQDDTPSLENILTLTNRFEDILRVTTNTDDTNGVEADLGNMKTTITASPTPTLRIHKDHPKIQIIEFPARVYKVEKAMYGLHQALRAWYGTLSKYLLTNGFQRGKIDQTLFIRRHKGDFILVQVYVDDIIFGSSNPQLCREFEALMHEKFQMSAMGELNFFLGLQIPLWTRRIPGEKTEMEKMHQVTPKECHLHAVKRIFRYLKGHPKLGLWYPKESPFDLVAYLDSDYGGASQDRKSTTEGC
nr:putative ribonuclease H-like domain-containing protein [Tanacetum cinerariifolium]